MADKKNPENPHELCQCNCHTAFAEGTGRSAIGASCRYCPHCERMIRTGDVYDRHVRRCAADDAAQQWRDWAQSISASETGPEPPHPGERRQRPRSEGFGPEQGDLCACACHAEGTLDGASKDSLDRCAQCPHCDAFIRGTSYPLHVSHCRPGGVQPRWQDALAALLTARWYSPAVYGPDATEDPTSAQAMLGTICQLGAAATPLLLELANASNPVARYAAAEGFGRLPSQEGKLALETLALDTALVATQSGCMRFDESVGTVAQRALREQNG